MVVRRLVRPGSHGQLTIVRRRRSLRRDVLRNVWRKSEELGPARSSKHKLGERQHEKEQRHHLPQAS